MNRKGFTLVELLATIVILGVIGGIATTGVLSAINKSKDKSEEIFVNKLSAVIEEYLDLYRGELQEKGTEYTFKKCKETGCNLNSTTNTYDATAKEMKKNDNSSIYLKELLNKKLIDLDDFINPRNKEKCLNSGENGPIIRVYRDSEYVYYYYVNLSTARCHISAKNQKINTLPNGLKSKVGLS